MTGTDINAQYTAPNGSVHIDLLNSSNTIVQSIATGVHGSSYSNWTLPTSLAEGTYRVRVTSDLTGAVAGVSQPILIVGSGHDYYVNDSSLTGDTTDTAVGNNANDGKSANTPMSSVEAVINTYHPGAGDTIHVENGNYNGIWMRDVDTVDANRIYSNTNLGVFVQGGNGRIFNNLVYDNSNGGIYINSTYAPIFITNNTVYQPVNDAINIANSIGDVVENNILWVEAGYDLDIAPNSQGGFFSDYNVFGSSQMTVDGITISLTTPGTVRFQPGTGTDSVTVNSGTRDLAATTGSSVTRANFSNISVAANATFNVESPATQSGRYLLDINSLSIAGTNNAWTGRLDLGSNDLDLPGGVRTAAATRWYATVFQSNLPVSTKDHVTRADDLLIQEDVLDLLDKLAAP